MKMSDGYYVYDAQCAHSVTICSTGFVVHVWVLSTDVIPSLPSTPLLRFSVARLFERNRVIILFTYFCRNGIKNAYTILKPSVIVVFFWQLLTARFLVCQFCMYQKSFHKPKAVHVYPIYIVIKINYTQAHPNFTKMTYVPLGV